MVGNNSRSFNEGSNKYKEKCSIACYSEAFKCNGYIERGDKDDQGEVVLGSSHGDMVVSDNGDHVHKTSNSEQPKSASGGDQLIISDHAEVPNAQSETKSSISVGRYGSRLNVSSERSSCRCGRRKHTDTHLTRKDMIGPKDTTRQSVISHIKIRKIRTDRTTRLLIAILCLFLISEFPQVSYVCECQSIQINNNCTIMKENISK